jgi:hypothetical protein
MYGISTYTAGGNKQHDKKLECVMELYLMTTNDGQNKECTVCTFNPSRANDEYKRKNLFGYPGHDSNAVSVHYAQQRAGAVNINLRQYFSNTRWQYSSIFIMIKRDFFVAIPEDAFVPANSIMAGRRFLDDEEIDFILEGDDDNLSEFSFGESESDINVACFANA